MCRLAAYLGQGLLLHKLLHEPPNSLTKQSWASEELQGTTLNADGFGFGWYLQDGAPAIYTSTLPIWSDTNLTGLEKSLHSGLWLAYVRSATPGQALSRANTQPFLHDQFLFMHNGRIEGFNEGPRTALHAYLDAEIASDIQGNTDSEYLFALFRQHYRQTSDPEAALAETCDALEKSLRGHAALVNIILSEGKNLYTCRHALNDGECPSLYYADSHPNYPGGVVIASERFSQPESWTEVARHHLLTIRPDRTLNAIAL